MVECRIGGVRAGGGCGGGAVVPAAAQGAEQQRSVQDIAVKRPGESYLRKRSMLLGLTLSCLSYHSMVGLSRTPHICTLT